MASALTCGEAFKKLSTYCFEEEKKKSFLEHLMDKKSSLKFTLPLVVVQTKKRYNLLLFDGRFDGGRQSDRVLCLVLDSEGRLVSSFDSVTRLPRLGRENFRKPRHAQERLCKLLDLSADIEDPKNVQETCDFLRENGKIDQVNVYYANRPKFINDQVMWNVAESSGQQHIEAFTNFDYTIGFRQKIMPPKRKQEIILNFEKENLTEENKHLEEDWNEKNRSCSVIVSLFGLNEAFNLGCCSSQEKEKLSLSLGRLTGSLHLVYDDSDSPRLATFYSPTSLKQFRLPEMWDKVINSSIFTASNKCLCNQKNKKNLIFFFLSFSGF
jgi:hypothetical protein